MRCVLIFRNQRSLVTQGGERHLQLAFTLSDYTIDLLDIIMEWSVDFESNMMDASELQYLAGMLTARSQDIAAVVSETIGVLAVYGSHDYSAISNRGGNTRVP